RGRLIGAPLRSSGEMVFTTGMVGYSEALSDPSYFGQILVFSSPLIGNYGIPPMPENLEQLLPSGFESRHVNVSGVIISSDSPEVFHWSSFQSLDQWLLQNKIPGICGLDTRHLVHLIREQKNPLAQIIPEKNSGYVALGTNNPIDLQKYEYFNPSEHELLSHISVTSPQKIGSGKKRVALVDCGVKWNIIRYLLQKSCEVLLLPWDYDFAKVDCDAWLLSNGPGDPLKTGGLINQVKKLIEENRPILGICLGHQILSLASGCKTQKMKYGHRSHNQPVQLCGTRKGFITSQNHGYEVISESLQDNWVPWFLNINDKSIEGIRHLEKPFMSVQFHPEAAGGPRDTAWVIDEFLSYVFK
ncbi:MAG: glutamine-hydrolyzing carbamoyl-phosphate synthase small subunit, partial [Oligoflexales bacterium]|nr:glutamine-hydrolyzing carbamoyl-phosphate synthase small subunit [Oligoflexales bacterium]